MLIKDGFSLLLENKNDNEKKELETKIEDFKDYIKINIQKQILNGTSAAHFQEKVEPLTPLKDLTGLLRIDIQTTSHLK